MLGLRRDTEKDEISNFVWLKKHTQRKILIFESSKAIPGKFTEGGFVESGPEST
jgi:hypothetical protein